MAHEYYCRIIPAYILRVYVREGEYILMGSSGMGVGAGGNVLYTEGQVPNSQITPVAWLPLRPLLLAAEQEWEIKYTCQRTARTHPECGGGWRIYSIVYTVPAGGTGTYWVAMYGPDGVNGSAEGSSGTIAVPEVGIAQSSGVSMWDITVRSGSATTGPNKPGRIYVDYLAQIPVQMHHRLHRRHYLQIFSTLYAVTTDGFVYKIDMNGLDPNGYIFYGNRVGFLQPDGKTPLYHDLVFLDNNLTTPAVGGTLMSPASAKLFFTNPLLSTDLPASILPTPIPPSITNVSYQGSAGGIMATNKLVALSFIQGISGGSVKLSSVGMGWIFHLIRLPTGAC